jgi:hypothetical protein
MSSYNADVTNKNSAQNEFISSPSELPNKFDIDISNYVFDRFKVDDNVIASDNLLMALPEFGVHTSKVFSGKFKLM